jgi:hypothetical protein
LVVQMTKMTLIDENDTDPTSKLTQFAQEIEI